MQPSDTVAGAGGSAGASCPCRKGRRFGIEQLAAAAADPAVAIATMDEAEERQQARPGAAALVHRVGMTRGIVEQAGMERADAIALVVERPRLAVGARRDEVAILGVEQEDEAEQNGQQSFVEMLRSARRQAPRCAPGRRHAGRAAARAARPAPARRASSRPPPARRGSALRSAGRRRSGASLCSRKAGEDELEAAEHRPAADLAERAQRKRQPAARLAARRVDEAQLAVGQQEARSGTPVLAQQPLQPLVRRRLPAFERAALFGIHAGASIRTRICQPLSGSATAQCGVEVRVALLDANRQVRPAAAARPARPRPVLRASRGSA